MNRYTVARGMGITDRAIALPLPPEQNDEMAQGAEHFLLDPYGYASYIDASGPRPCDWEGYPEDTDTMVHGDVKWTPRENGGLMVSVAKVQKHRCDIYALVVGSDYRLAGWCFGDELVEHPDTSGRSRVPSYYMTQSELHSPATFPGVMLTLFEERLSRSQKSLLLRSIRLPYTAA